MNENSENNNIGLEQPQVINPVNSNVDLGETQVIQQPIQTNEVPVEQNVVVEPVNTNVGNEGNNKPKNNKTLLIVIIAIALIALIVAGVLIYKSMNEENTTNDTSEKEDKKDNEVVEENNIKQIYIEDQRVLAIDNNNDLYIALVNNKAGGKAQYKNYGFEKEPEYPAKIASDVKSVHLDSSYVDSKGDLYSTFIAPDGSYNYEFVKMYSNVKLVKQKSSFCASYINDNNELMVENGYGSNYCGVSSKDIGLKKYADNVKDFVVYYKYTAFINESNELYILSADEVVKQKDNITDIRLQNSILFTLDTDKNLKYYFVDDEELDNGKEVNELGHSKQINSNVTEFGEYHYKTSDNKLYVFTDPDTSGEKNLTGVLSGYIYDYYLQLDTDEINDFKEALTPIMSDNNYRLVYLNTDNNIVLLELEADGSELSIKDKKVVSNNINSIDDIAEFYNTTK